ncbi:hypothetical protein PISMIDRAFT_671401 [Pisolithus microcarpus 441]|uniref:RFX-type winged-helix domain-containing protein n=1 Tax=Pisolithus microcarpus 441 TaxID=765257 RepID=A0A0C9ZLD4_9AGAM|nr:hypothetical protein PISMIDRAFT_671401 [Pisolithus microcarpus 441]
MALQTPVRAGTATPSFYRAYAQQTAQRGGPNVTDDYERWYTDATPSNRMVLSLRCGIHTEIGWALDRLHRLCTNDQFALKAIPSLTEALFEWPEWYVTEGHLESENCSFFTPSTVAEKKRRHAVESLFILRNSVVNEPNIHELANYPRTQPLLFRALTNLDVDAETNSEFLLNTIELLQAISQGVVLPPPSADGKDPLAGLLHIVEHSCNRSLIIATLTLLGQLFSNSSNLPRLQAESPALSASIRYLPLFVDKPLVEASLNYLYAHLSHPPMVKAFFHHCMMPGALRVLVSLLLSEQVEETVSRDISIPARTIPAVTTVTPDHDLTQEELDRLLPMPEPQRCYEWMRTMFVAKPEGEMTQVDFWNLYKDAFTPHVERFPVLVASDVIKNVNVVFPQAQAMVLPGPPQRFVVRGVDRRKEAQDGPRFRCHWEKSQCSVPAFGSAGELYDHLLQHIDALEVTETTCLWSTCSVPLSKARLRSHVLTHMPSAQLPAKHASQDETVTLSSTDGETYPIVNPTRREPPPLRNAAITFRQPVADPPSTSLTALLIIRILFRTSFVATDLAPRADGERFGFPGVVVEDEGDNVTNEEYAYEAEGERRGRRAFVGVRRMMEDVRIKDETLMGWILEMIHAAYDGLPQS